MGAIAHILNGLQRKGYEKIVAVDLLRRMRNTFPETLTGKMNTVRTAESYIANCVHLEVVRRVGGYLKLTSEGEVLLCLDDFSRVPPPFKLTQEERAFFLHQLLKLDKPCFFALLSCLERLEEASLTEVAKGIEHPTYSRLGIKARLHRIGARLEWAGDLDLAKKKDGLYLLSESGRRLLLQTDQDRWKMIGTTYLGKPPMDNVEYEWFLSNAAKGYSLLARLNRFDVYVDLESLILYLRIQSLPKWLLRKQTVEDFLSKAWDRNQRNLHFLSSRKRDQMSETYTIKGKQFKYMYIS